MFRRRSAFSLMEVLVAIAILGMGLVALFNIFPSAWHSFAYSRVLNRIALLAQQKLEEIKSTDTRAAGQSSGKENDLSWTLSITPVKLEPNVELMRVQLEVEFSYMGMPQKELFVTYRSPG